MKERSIKITSGINSLEAFKTGDENIESRFEAAAKGAAALFKTAAPADVFIAPDAMAVNMAVYSQKPQFAGGGAPVVLPFDYYNSFSETEIKALIVAEMFRVKYVKNLFKCIWFAAAAAVFLIIYRGALFPFMAAAFFLTVIALILAAIVPFIILDKKTARLLGGGESLAGALEKLQQSCFERGGSGIMHPFFFNIRMKKLKKAAAGSVLEK